MLEVRLELGEFPHTLLVAMRMATGVLDDFVIFLEGAEKYDLHGIAITLGPNGRSVRMVGKRKHQVHGFAGVRDGQDLLEPGMLQRLAHQAGVRIESEEFAIQDPEGVEPLVEPGRLDFRVGEIGVFHVIEIVGRFMLMVPDGDHEGNGTGEVCDRGEIFGFKPVNIRPRPNDIASMHDQVHRVVPIGPVFCDQGLQDVFAHDREVGRDRVVVA